jgi:hypothetical protein
MNNIFYNENIILSNALSLGNNDPLSKIIFSYVFSLPKLCMEKDEFKKKKYCEKLNHFTTSCILCDHTHPICFHLDQYNNFIIDVSNDYINDYLVCIYCMFKIFTSCDPHDTYCESNQWLEHDGEFYNYEDYNDLVKILLPFAKFDQVVNLRSYLEECCDRQDKYIFGRYDEKFKIELVEAKINLYCKECDLYYKECDINYSHGCCEAHIIEYNCSLCGNSSKCYQLIHCDGTDVTNNESYNFKQDNWIILCEECRPRGTNHCVRIGTHSYIITSISNNNLNTSAENNADPKLLFLYIFWKQFRLPGVIVDNFLI